MSRSKKRPLSRSGVAGLNVFELAAMGGLIGPRANSQGGLYFSSDLLGTGNYDAYAGNAQVVVKGARKLTNIQDARKVPQYTKEYINVVADIAPMTAFMDKVGANKVVGQATYFHLLYDMNPRTVTYGTSTGETTGTTLTLAAGEGNKIDLSQLLYVERTNEVIRVTAINTDTLTVSRAFGTGGGVAATINDAEVIQVLGSAFAENSTAGSGISTEPNIITNACQTFRAFIEASGRDIASENYGPAEWDRMKQLKLEDLQIQRESAFLFNPAIATSDPTMTKGLLGWISTNVFNQAGILDEVSLANWNKAWQRHNVGQAKNLIAFCGDNVRTAIDGFGRDALRLTPASDMLGVAIEAWQSSFGQMKLMQHGMLTPLGSSQTAANRGRVGFMIGVNTKMIGKRTFKGRGLTFSDHIETPGTDGTKAGWTLDEGFACLSEKAHFFAYGITG